MLVIRVRRTISRIVPGFVFQFSQRRERVVRSDTFFDRFLYLFGRQRLGQGRGEVFLREATQVKNIWVPYGE